MLRQRDGVSIDSLRMCHRGVDGDTTWDPEVPEGKVDQVRRELQTIRIAAPRPSVADSPMASRITSSITGFVLGALHPRTHHFDVDGCVRGLRGNGRGIQPDLRYR